jgi:SAM-dependent methyltransferase
MTSRNRAYSTADVDAHYGRGGGLLERIERGLDLAGKDPATLKVEDLAPVDAFHSRGSEGTKDAIAAAARSGVVLTEGTRLLDVGCGFGGTARHLAAAFGCRVTGVDLTREFVAVGRELTRRVGLDGRVSIVQGSALELPFNEATDELFDVAWTEHVQMNIADKQKFYGEIARVLKPGGSLVFHDVFRGRSPDDPVYPVPWADHPDLSKLGEEEDIRTAIQQAGLEALDWQDKTAETIEFFDKALEKIAKEGPPPLGIHLLMGTTARDKLRNHLFNLKEGRTVVVMGVVTKKEVPN